MPGKIGKIIFIVAMTLLTAMGLTLLSCSPATWEEPTPVMTDPGLLTITLTPEFVNFFVVGSTQQFTAEGTYSDTSKADITSLVTCWGTSDASVATISKSGLVTAVAPGTCYITAAFSGVGNGSVVILTVVPQQLVSQNNNS